ncbi:MAG: hypothetical protein Q7S22_07645 [Candidatus Micrarchaeota archaeon]|nr:hypothetical protein [Candidatus Micrarchaeota archaeon]
MRQRTSRATFVKPRTSALLLAEGLAKPNVQIVTLAGQTFEIPMRGKLRKWAGMTNAEIVEFAKAYCKEKGIIKSTELYNADGGLYRTLKGRQTPDGKNLLDQVFERKQFDEVVLGVQTFIIPLNKRGMEGNRNWLAMSNEQLLEFTRAYCKGKKITKSSELEKGENADSGLWGALSKRKTPDGKNLLDQVFERKDFKEVTLDGKTFRIPLNAKQQRNWAAMSNDQIIVYAKAHCKENRITKSRELQVSPKGDSGLWSILQIRNLLDRVFSDIRASQAASALTELASALESFGGSGK